MSGPAMAAPDWLRRAARPVRDARRHRAELDADRGVWQAQWAVERELDDLTRGDHPVLVGPWSSEVGYEVLYWIPFLRWVRDAFRLDPARVVAVSRGGVASWYRDVAAQYLEIWDEYTPETFAARTAERGSVKQMDESPFDRDMADRAVSRLGLVGARVLHPSLMYRLFSLYWSGRRPAGFLDAHTRFERMTPPDESTLPPLPGLPPEYVAVKLYAARSMPDTPDVRRLLARLVAELAAQQSVVLLDTGLVLDEHADYDVPTGPRVVSAREWMRPRDNLAVQTRLIAGARAFVGTCGSLAWLAPMLGVRTAALFVDSKWLHAHLGVALRAAHRVNGVFAPADLRGLYPLANL